MQKITRSVKHIVLAFVLLLLAVIALTTGWITFVVESYIRDERLAALAGDPPSSFTWTFLVVGCLLFVLLLVGLIVFFTKLLFEIRYNQRQSNFIASVTHELKSPLSAIKLYAQSLQLQEVEPAERIRFLKGIVDDVRRLDSLISNIMEAGKVDQDCLDYRFEELDIRAVLDDFFARNADRAASRGLELDVRIDASGPVRIDVLRFDQVLENLLDNAIKYSEQGGRVSFAARREGEVYRMAFEDRGIGFDRTEADNLFGRFYRASNSDARRRKGTGLGLFITRCLVEAHGGRIAAESPGRGKGARFTVDLPVATSQAAPALAHGRAAPAPSGTGVATGA